MASDNIGVPLEKAISQRGKIGLRKGLQTHIHKFNEGLKAYREEQFEFKLYFDENGNVAFKEPEVKS